MGLRSFETLCDDVVTTRDMIGANHNKPSLLIVGAGFDGGGATPAVLCEIFTQKAFSDFDITFFGYGPVGVSTQKGIRCINICDPYIGFSHIFVRAYRKARFLLREDVFPSGVGYVTNCLKKATKMKKFDMVLGTPGTFMECAYRFSKATGSPFSMIYTDPFSENPLSIAFKEERARIERRWERDASLIFYDHDGPEPPFIEYIDKKHEFYLPIPKPVVALPRRKKTIVYGGSFYPGLREPNGIFELARREDMKDYTFDIYSNVKAPSEATNVKVHGFTSVDKFKEVCLESSAVIVVGNKTSVTYMPSKFLTDISLRRPIIGVDTGSELLYLQKYPFFINYKDERLPQKLEAFSTDELLSFQPYRAFPERKPEDIANVFQTYIVATFL
jgi:hypothetical protein